MLRGATETAQHRGGKAVYTGAERPNTVTLFIFFTFTIPVTNRPQSLPDTQHHHRPRIVERRLPSSRGSTHLGCTLLTGHERAKKDPLYVKPGAAPISKDVLLLKVYSVDWRRNLFALFSQGSIPGVAVISQVEVRFLFPASDHNSVFQKS